MVAAVSLSCVGVILFAVVESGTLCVHVSAGAGSYALFGVPCGDDGLESALALLVSRADRDSDGCSLLRIHITADDDAPFEHVRGVMDACARHDVYRVDWQWENLTLPVYVRKERDTGGCWDVIYGPRARITAGPPVAYEVQRMPCADPVVAAALLREYRDRTPRPVELTIEDAVQFKVAFAFVAEITRDPRIDVALRDLAIHTRSLAYAPYNRGVRDAKDDAAQGVFRLVRYGYPAHYDLHILREALLLDRYGVQTDDRGCCIEYREDEYIKGYNYAMRAALRSLHGVDVQRECEEMAGEIAAGKLPRVREALLRCPDTAWMLEHAAIVVQVDE